MGVGNNLLVADERRDCEQALGIETIECGLNLGVVVAVTRLHKREANTTAIALREISVGDSDLSVVHRYRCR